MVDIPSLIKVPSIVVSRCYALPVPNGVRLVFTERAQISPEDFVETAHSSMTVGAEDALIMAKAIFTTLGVKYTIEVPAAEEPKKYEEPKKNEEPQMDQGPANLANPVNEAKLPIPDDALAANGTDGTDGPQETV